MSLINQRLPTDFWWTSDHVGLQSRPYRGRSDSESRFFQDRLRYLEVPSPFGRCLVAHITCISPSL